MPSLRERLRAFISSPTQETAPKESQPPPVEQLDRSVEEEKPPIEQPKPPPDGVYLGIPIEDTADAEDGLWLPSKLRGRHLYLIGKTRTGKTTLIKNLIIQDMQQGHGLCSIDPHGDCAEELLANVPPERIKDVIYFDPSHTFSPSFNFFRLPFPPYKLTEDVVAVFRMFFGSAWGVRMEHLLRYGLLTLLSDSEPHTLPDLRTLCLNADFRADLIARVQDKTLREFWEQEFPTIEKGAFNPIINKLSAFLLPGSPLLRVFSDPENDLDFSAIMNGQKILIVNLAKGVLGDEPSRLLGGLIVTGIQQAALARADIPPDQRKEFHLYIDEFQNFVVDSISTILSESAKYQLFLTLAHQTLGQLPTGIERSIFGNIATLISFQISAEDAGTLRREMHRSRFTCRAKETNDYRPLGEFIDSQRKSAQVFMHNAQENLEKARARLNELNSKEGARNFTKSMNRGGITGSEAEKELRAAHNVQISAIHSLEHSILEFERTLKRYDRSDLNPAMLKELFPDYEFRQQDFPDPDDFINMQARHAFCRMERADNVTAFRTVAPPDPVAGIKGQILHAMRERHAERAKAHAPKPQPHTEEQPAVAVGAEYAQAAEPRHEPPNLRVVKGGRGSTQAPTRKKPSTDEEFEF